MERVVHKLSVVYLATGENLEVYRSLDEISTETRERMVKLAKTMQVETRIIANESGRALLLADARKAKPSPTRTPLPNWARWSIVFALGSGVGLLLTWVMQLH